MAKYVLGEEGARKFKQLVQGDLQSGNSLRNGKTHALDNQYPHPYEVRWSNSIPAAGDGGNPERGYIIWLPDNCLYVSGSYIPLSDFPQISQEIIKPIKQGSHWYKLTPESLRVSSAGESGQWPDNFDIWLHDYTTAPIFSSKQNLDEGGEGESNNQSGSRDGESSGGGSSGAAAEIVKSNPIHITKISNYRSCPSVKSSIIHDVKADERSIVLLTEDYGDLRQKPWHDKLHFSGFYFDNRGTTWGSNVDIVSRRWYGDPASDGQPYLEYNTYDSLRNDIMEGVANYLDDANIKSIDADEQSISIGKDGWPVQSQISQGGNESGSGSRDGTSTETNSNEQGEEADSSESKILHMWHFHDSSADVENPEMCDFVLRYNPDRASPDKWLRYISYEDLKDKLETDIGGGGSGGEITPDQLKDIPCWGMFAWTEKTRTIGVGGCMVGRKWYSCSEGIGAGKPDALYQLRVTITQNGSVSLAVVSDATLGQNPTTTQSWIPIYQIADGKISADYRGAFVVPAYE